MPIRNPRRADAPQPRHAFPQPPMAPRMYRNIAVTFLAVVVVVIGIVVWISSVKASVIIHVKSETTKIDSIVDIAKNPEEGQLQGRVVEGTFDNIQEFKVTEQPSSTVMTTATKGRVKIINTYSKAQPLVKTTRLLTADGKLFRINATITVLPNQSVEVDAYSDKSGQEFAIPAGTKFTIPGLWTDLQKWIYAESVTSFSGDTKNVKLVSQADIANAQGTLSQTVVDQAKKTLMAEAGMTAEMLSDDCPTTSQCWQAIYFVSPLEKKTNVSAGQESDGFLAQVKEKVTGVFYPRKDMELLVRSKLKDRLPDGKEIYKFDPATVTYTLDQIDSVTEKARVRFTAQASSRLTAQTPAFSKDLLTGLSIGEAKQKLLLIDGVQSIDIHMNPSWAHTLPSRKEAIDVKIE